MSKDRWGVYVKRGGKCDAYYLARFQMDVPSGAHEVDHFMAEGKMEAMRSGAEIVRKLRLAADKVAEVLDNRKKSEEECEDCQKRIRCFKHCSRGDV